MDLGAGTAGAGVAHHPEVVLLVAVDDVDVGIMTDAEELLGPDVPGFLVAVSGVTSAEAGTVGNTTLPMLKVTLSPST